MNRAGKYWSTLGGNYPDIIRQTPRFIIYIRTVYSRTSKEFWRGWDGIVADGGKYAQRRIISVLISTDYWENYA